MIKIYIKYKKALSGPFAVSLFVLVTIISIVLFQNWFFSYSSVSYVDVDTSDNIESYSTDIEIITDTTIYLKNSYRDLDINTVMVDKVDCDFKHSLSTSDRIKIDIGDCLVNSENEIIEVLITTDHGIFAEKISKKLYDPYPNRKYVWKTTATTGKATSYGIPSCENNVQPSGTCFEDFDQCEVYSNIKGEWYDKWDCEYKTKYYVWDETNGRAVTYNLPSCYNNTVPVGNCNSEGYKCEVYNNFKGEWYTEYTCTGPYYS